MLQLAYTDRLLGTLIERMEATGLWDYVLVVLLTAPPPSSRNEGPALAGPPRGRGGPCRGPVFIKEPGQSKGVTSDANWEHVDLLPTVADALGVTVPFRVDGISQLSARPARTQKFFYNEPGERIEFAPDRLQDRPRGRDRRPRPRARGRRRAVRDGQPPRRDRQEPLSLASLGVDVDSPPSRLTAQVDEAVDFDSVDPSTGIVPALVWGTLSRSTGKPVVIAVNGTAAAVSEVWRNEGEPTFQGMVNDELFKPGANDIQLYQVVGEPHPRLRRIHVTQS